jgi:predicted unusual protein kinase regulating ubiquinone biosynthesis (AarF/ABC1/UbiB family)
VQLRNAISGLGPAIIKAGQALASRPDLLPSEYLEELQKLQDDVPRFSNELAFDIVEQELGVQFEDVFELEQDEPVAAASIGQGMFLIDIVKTRCSAAVCLCDGIIVQSPSWVPSNVS